MTGSQQAAGAPLITVILAVRGVEEYLPGCLDSILGQPDLAAGIEVIAVDDASPDGCGAILDARAAVDPRRLQPRPECPDRASIVSRARVRHRHRRSCPLLIALR